MYASVSTVRAFPKRLVWVVSLHLKHDSVILGRIAYNDEDGDYEITVNNVQDNNGYLTLADAAYRIVWLTADKSVSIYFSHASLKWAMEHDDAQDIQFRGKVNV